MKTKPTSPRPRDDASTIRILQVLEFCAEEPRTMELIMERFDGDRRYRFAAYNAVARGQLENLNAGKGRRYPGLFAATNAGRTECEAAPRAMSIPTGRRVNSVWQLGAAS